MKNNLTPEEKLLRLIKNKNKEEANASVSAIKPPNLIKKENLNLFLKKFLNLKYIFIILIAAVVISFGYLVFEILFVGETKPSAIKSEEKIEKKPEIKQVPIPEAAPFDYYAEKLNKRDIFKPIGQETVGQTGTSTTLGELASNLRLAGIIVDKQPQAIIEDTKLKKTYFLNKGDYIDEIKVEEILEGKVILSLNGEKVELIP